MSRSPMRRLKVPIALLAVLSVPAGGLLSAPSALADGTAAITDCNANGHLTGSYSRGSLQSALTGMGADVKEYTNCYDVIRRALLASATGGGGSPSGGSGPSSGGPGASGGSGAGGTAGQSPSRAGAGVSTRGVYGVSPNAVATGPGSDRAIKLDGASITPGTTGLGSAVGTRSLPTPLIAVLVLLGLAALAGVGVAIRRRVLARSGA